MSCSIQLVRLDDFIADIDVLDLSANGYSLAVDGYFPTAAPLGAQSVREVITLKLQGTSKDDLAAMTQEIDEKIKQVEWWLNDPGVERYQVWIRVQLENESLPRQAQIISIMPPDKVRVFTPEERLDNYIGDYQIGIERTPYWEDPYPYPTTTGLGSIDVLGGQFQLSETINGDVPARIPKISITPSPSAVLGSYWIGWKTDRFGDPANFVSVWPQHLSAFTLPDVSSDADTEAYDGTRLTCDFSTTPTLSRRSIVRIIDVTANANDQRGSYTVILRAKMNDTSVARVRLVYGWCGTFAMLTEIYRSRVVVSGSTWQLYDLGSIKLPPSFIQPSFAMNNAAIAIDAERISGSGSIYLDSLILVPYDDGQIKSTFADKDYTVNVNIYQRANGVLIGSSDSAGIVGSTLTLNPINWGLPAEGSPVLILAASGNSNASVKSDVVTGSYTYIPRWRTLRGNVT